MRVSEGEGEGEGKGEGEGEGEGEGVGVGEGECFRDEDAPSHQSRAGQCELSLYNGTMGL